MPEYNPTLIEKFWRQVNKNGPIVRPELGPCWLWTGACAKSGYGVLNIKLAVCSWKVTTTHRIAWALATGEIPSPAWMICHHCDVRLCVRPDHLFKGTAADNNRDMFEKGRYARPAARLTPEAVNEIRQMVLGVSTWDRRNLFGIISIRYGIGRRHIGAIVRGEHWKNIKA